MNYTGPAMSHNSYLGDNTGESPSEQLALRQYLFVLRKYALPIALFTLIVTAIAAVYAIRATPVYQATATLLLEEQGVNVVPIEGLYEVDSESADYFDTQFQLLRSRTLAHRVVERLSLWDHPELVDKKEAGEKSTDAATAAQGTTADSSTTVGSTNLVSTRQRELTISAFRKRLKISAVGSTKLVNISYTSADAELAARVANTVGEEYIQNFLDAKLTLTSTASTWLEQRLGELKVDVDAAEQRLIAFQRDNNLIGIQGNVGRLNEQQLLLDSAELTQARSQLAAAQGLYNNVQSLRGNPELLETIPAVQTDPLVQRSNIERGNIQRELDELLTRYGARHPRVLDKKSELASLSGTLERHINRVADTIAKDFQSAQQRVASISAKLSDGRSQIQLIGDKTYELNTLQNELDAKRSVYDQYFNRMTEAASQDGLESANARITDWARIPVESINLNKFLIIAAAALVSLLISVLLAFLREALDDTVKGTNDVESKLGVQLLGVLPMVKSGLMKRSAPLPLNPEKTTGQSDIFAEAVNSVRTSLTLNDLNKSRKVIVVTSSIRGEGKSTSSMNIAYSLGQLERVLLIDCDLRRPSVAKAAGLPSNTKGLSNLISNTATAEECIQRGQFGGHVDILPSGPIPDQPLELLSSKRFERIIQEVGQFYDRIVIDTAPTQAVSDALVLSRLADSVVYVVKSHETPIALVRRGIARLRQTGAQIEGVLMTQVDIEKAKGYCGNYSYEGYHDTYDAYNYADNGKQASSKLKLTSQQILAIRNDEDNVNLGISSLYGDTPKIKMTARAPATESRLHRRRNKVAAERKRPKYTAQMETH